MSEIQLTQNSAEWHEHRKKYRNASEAGAVMGVDPYCTPYELWLRKQGLSEFKGNVATRHGHKLEPEALAKASRILGVKLEPKVFVNGDYSASFDGVNGDSWHVEIKCPYKGTSSALWRQSYDEADPIPKPYYWQMVHQYHVKRCAHKYLFIYISDDIWNLVPFYPKQGDEILLMEAWDDFCENPPEPPEDDLSYDFILCGYVDSLRLVRQEAAELKAREQQLTEHLIKRAQEAGKAITVKGMKVQQVSRKGNVQYQRIPELKGIDLDDYRKPPTLYWKVS